MQSSIDSEWNDLKNAVFERDGYKCKVCRVNAKTNRGVILTCHHKIPRSEGGQDVMENLETLCSRCHDKEELAIEEGGKITLPKEHVWDKPSMKELDWHKWVYGGCKNPNI